MNYKKILLLAASCLFITIFFSKKSNDPNEVFSYYSWVDSKIFNFFGFSDYQSEVDQFDYQLSHLNIDYRKATRLGTTYAFCQNMKQFFETQKEKNPLVLLPSEEYIKANNVNIGGQLLLIPEPIIFYLETDGLKGAWTISKDVDKVTWTVVADGKGGLEPVKITSKEQLDSIIKEFNKYKY